MFEVKLKSHSSLYPYMQDYIHEREIKGICTVILNAILRVLDIAVTIFHVNIIIIGLTVLRAMKHTNPCTYVV